jgi:glycosyltransferase involved in cell wall biosynthesis
MSLPANTVRVSFFVQAYNTAAYVGECLESILSQQGAVDFDVLVIDDASTDGTDREIARFKDARLRVIRHERNQGAIATANEGYASVTGTFVVRVDSDDRLRPGFLTRSVPILERHADVGLVYGDIATIDQAGHITSPGGLVQRHGQPAMGNEFFGLLLENYIPAPSTMMRRDALAALLPIPRDLRFLDWYLTTGITEQWNSAYIDDVLAEYRIHNDNMHRAMILDRGGEATSLRVLDALFGSPVRKAEKQRWRRRVYASCYLTYAEKYFGSGMNRDARRCYWQAGVRRPATLLDARVARHFGAVLFGRRLYDAFKAALRPAKPRADSLAR